MSCFWGGLASCGPLSCLLYYSLFSDFLVVSFFLGQELIAMAGMMENERVTRGEVKSNQIVGAGSWLINCRSEVKSASDRHGASSQLPTIWFDSLPPSSPSLSIMPAIRQLFLPPKKRRPQESHWKSVNKSKQSEVPQGGKAPLKNMTFCHRWPVSSHFKSQSLFHGAPVTIAICQEDDSNAGSAASASNFQLLTTNIFVVYELLEWRKQLDWFLCPCALCFNCLPQLQWITSEVPRTLGPFRLVLTGHIWCSSSGYTIHGELILLFFNFQIQFY